MRIYRWYIRTTESISGISNCISYGDKSYIRTSEPISEHQNVSQDIGIKASLNHITDWTAVAAADIQKTGGGERGNTKDTKLGPERR